MSTSEKYQQQLLQQIQQRFRRTPISEAAARAFVMVPRHHFVKRYREWGTTTWQQVNDDTIDEHAATIYAMRTLILAGEDDDVRSTISEPGFVLHMLDLLQIEPGHRVFELGTGSGWNAALIAYLVGSSGHVWTAEIIPELAESARNIMSDLGIDNVDVVAADGGEGLSAGAPYDRATFTAGTFDLPRPFYDQLREGALLLAVIKNEGGGDNLFILRKVGDHFESTLSMSCAFVQLHGKFRMEGLEPVALASIPGWSALSQHETSRIPFWWGGKGEESFLLRTLGIRSWLGITEPLFRTFAPDDAPQRPGGSSPFGIVSRDGNSVAIADHDHIVGYGTPQAQRRLIADLHDWIDRGMPAASCFTLKVFPIEAEVTAGANQWLVRRRESQFLWSLS